MEKHSDLFTNRQLASLTTFSDMVAEAARKVRADFPELQASCPPTHSSKEPVGGTPEPSEAAGKYASAVATYLGFAVSKAADLASNLCRWQSNAEHLKLAPVFSRQAISMTWDYGEGNPFRRPAGFTLPAAWRLAARW
jgi:putative DNA methylase